MSSSSFYSDSGITTADADAVESSKNAAAQSAQDAAGHASTASEKATEANDSAVAAAASASTANNSNVQAVAINLYSTNTIGTVAGNIADINTVASMESDVDTLANATYKAKVETVADAAYKSDVETVAASGYKSDVETVADATYKAKVETVANSTYKSKVEEVAADLSGSNTIGAAVQSASDAATSASNAATSEANSLSNLQSVIAQAYNISTHAATASGHADDAEDAKTDAQAARDAAQGHRTQTGLDATAAAASANSATSSASAAATSEANAASSEQNAQGYSNAASGSASSANTNALVAISEASDAADSASTASTASASAVAANTAAQAAKDDAEDAKDAAELAKTAAETAQTNASNYASTASTSASTATTKASEASSSAAAANTSATNAGVSYTNAFNAATDSVNAASTWSSFYTTYLGSYSSPPTTDVQGNPIVTGAFYYDTGAGSNTVGLYVYNGSSWVYSTNYNNVTAPYSLSQDLATNGNDISFGTGAKANFGASDDLQIYHDGSNSRILESGVGFLAIGTNGTDIRLTGNNFNEYMAKFEQDGAATLYYNNSAKIATTSTGISVTGDINGTGDVIIESPNPYLDLKDTTNPSTFRIHNADSTVRYYADKNDEKNSSKHEFRVDGEKQVATFRGGGDVFFYEDTGTTPKFFWDASAERLGIGTTSPVSPLHIQGTDNVAVRIKATGENSLSRLLLQNDGRTWTIDNDGANADALTFYDATAVAERMRIDSSGNVGIGTTSPNYELTVAGGGNNSIQIVSSTTGTGANNGLRFWNTGSSTAMWNYDNTPTLFATNNTERMRIDSSGNVGIGGNPAAVTHGPHLDLVGNRGTLTVGTGYFEDNGNTNFIGGARSLAFGSAGSSTERMRIDASGNVGIGTSSPLGSFHVKNTSDNATPTSVSDSVLISHQSGSYTSGNYYGLLGWARANSNGTTLSAFIAPTMGDSGTYGDLTFGTGVTPIERMRIDASGNVGIGTTSPSALLHVKNNDAGFEVDVDNQVTDGVRLLAYDRNTSVERPMQYRASQHIFRDGTAERMRIDSSGNLLVGKTSAVYNTAGTQLASDGQVFITGGNQYGLAVNRTTGDGDLVLFSKDGTTVGSIGVVTSDNLYIQGNSSHHGLAFGSNSLVPFKNSAYVDSSCALGSSFYRFTDLYLSGGAYLGGTGSANKLDDYEEGTWTPTLIGSTGGSATMTVARNNYTKVGNMCTAYMYVNAVDTTGSFSGDVRIGGLPFAAGNNFEQAVTVTYCNLFNFDEADRTVSGYVSGTQIWLHNGSSNATISTSNLNSASNGVTMLAVTYRTA